MTPTTDQQGYEVVAVEYASMTQDKSSYYHQFEQYGERDVLAPISFYFWVIRRGDLVVLVDCGMRLATAHARGFPVSGIDPEEALRHFGVEPADVDHVVISHMHFDHVGCLDLFPHAQFTIADAEYDFWTGPYADRAFFACASQPDEVVAIQRLAQAGRLRWIEEETEILPGITVTPFRGHTPGQIITQVSTDAGLVVLASDAAHFYEEIDKDRPFFLFNDLEGMYRCYDYLRELAARPDTWVVPGHDPLVMSRFERIADGCVDLTRRLPDADTVPVA
ncbi:N-acyl homoserine lactonase family protein [Tsukamurella soli]|uniref:N-acyl homoserine lactonase family protein n=1 Tax=Tsukamurella soli TaxID=644556 RepID=A0ABP8KB56_9ACTN